MFDLKKKMYMEDIFIFISSPIFFSVERKAASGDTSTTG